MDKESRQKKITNKKRMLWVRKEFGKKARGKAMNQKERGDLMKKVWEEARKKFPMKE